MHLIPYLLVGRMQGLFFYLVSPFGLIYGVYNNSLSVLWTYLSVGYLTISLYRYMGLLLENYTLRWLAIILRE